MESARVRDVIGVISDRGPGNGRERFINITYVCIYIHTCTYYIRAGSGTYSGELFLNILRIHFSLMISEKK